MDINKNQIRIEQNNKRMGSIMVASTGISQMAIFLLKKKAQGMLDRIFFPDALIADIESFVVRNSNGVSDEDLHTACPNCLKAYVLSKASEHGLDPRSIAYIREIFEGEVGHEGYYLDEDELVKI